MIVDPGAFCTIVFLIHHHYARYSDRLLENSRLTKEAQLWTRWLTLLGPKLQKLKPKKTGLKPFVVQPATKIRRYELHFDMVTSPICKRASWPLRLRRYKARQSGTSQGEKKAATAGIRIWFGVTRRVK